MCLCLYVFQIYFIQDSAVAEPNKDEQSGSTHRMPAEPSTPSSRFKPLVNATQSRPSTSEGGHEIDTTGGTTGATSGATGGATTSSATSGATPEVKKGQSAMKDTPNIPTRKTVRQLRSCQRLNLRYFK